MTREEVLDLLSLIVAHDNRNVSEADVATWAEHAERGRWSWQEAKDAVVSHFHHSSEWCMPGHVAAIITGQRQDAASRRLAQHRELENQPASHQRVREIVAQVSGSLGWVPKHSPVLSVSCPHCRATVGYPCTRPGKAGHKPTAVAAHPSRRAQANEHADSAHSTAPHTDTESECDDDTSEGCSSRHRRNQRPDPAGGTSRTAVGGAQPDESAARRSETTRS